MTEESDNKLHEPSIWPGNIHIDERVSFKNSEGTQYVGLDQSRNLKFQTTSREAFLEATEKERREIFVKTKDGQYWILMTSAADLQGYERAVQVYEERERKEALEAGQSTDDPGTQRRKSTVPHRGRTLDVDLIDLDASTTTRPDHVVLTTADKSIIGAAFTQHHARDVPRYHGKYYEDVRDWIQSYERYGKTYGWTNEDYLSFLYVALQETAARWHESERHHHATWTKLRDSLVKAFGKTKLDYLIENQKVKFTVDDPRAYVDNVLKMVEVDNINASEKEKIDKLLDGLPPKWRVHFVTNEPATVQKFLERLKDETRKNALRQKISNEEEDKPKEETTKTTVTSLRTQPVPAYALMPSSAEMGMQQQMAAVQQQMNQMMQLYNNATQQQQQPRQQQQPIQTRPAINHQRAPDGRPICSKCGKTGHIMNVCRSSPGNAPTSYGPPPPPRFQYKPQQAQLPIQYPQQHFQRTTYDTPKAIQNFFISDPASSTGPVQWSEAAEN